MTLATHPRLRLFTLCALYLAQGVPTGFVSITLAAFLAREGAPLTEVASLLAISWVPWSFKLFYGPLLDQLSSAMGRRRPGMLLAHGMMAFTLLLLLLIPDLAAELLLLKVLVFVHNSFSALQDVATDALAVDLLDTRERGRANGLMWSAKVGGVALGGSGMSTVIRYTDIQTALWVQIAIVLLVALLPLLFREREGDHFFAPVCRRARTTRWLSGMADTLQVLLRQPATLVLGMLALVATLPTRMVMVIGPVFAVQGAGWTDIAYAQFTGGPALLAGVIGALVGGSLVDYKGRKPVIMIASLALWAMLTAFSSASSWWAHKGVVMAFICGGVFLDMTIKMGLFALFMDAIRPGIEATQYTLFMTLGNLCNVVGGVLIIPFDLLFSYEQIFLYTGLITVLPLLLLWRLPTLHPAPVPISRTA